MLGMVALGAACAPLGPAAPPPPQVVREPVNCEQLEYVLVKDGRTLGTGTLASAYRDAGERSGWDLQQTYTPGGEYSDWSQAYVRPQFQPMNSERGLDRPGGGERHSADYERTPGTAVMRSWRQDGERETESTAELRLRPNAYDNESSFWMWRSLPLAEGYVTRYTSVNAFERNQSTVDLSVVGTATVTVPAGTFETWRVLVVAGRASRTAWIEVAPPHRLVQWDNGVSFMQLEREVARSAICLPQSAGSRP